MLGMAVGEERSIYLRIEIRKAVTFGEKTYRFVQAVVRFLGNGFPLMRLLSAKKIGAGDSSFFFFEKKTIWRYIWQDN